MEQKIANLENILDYGDEFISHILGMLLTDRSFLETVVADINLDDYENESQRWLIKEIIKYHEEYRTVPSKNYLRIALTEVTANHTNPAKGKLLKETTGQLIKSAYDSIANNIEPSFPKKFKKFCQTKAVERAAESIFMLAKVNDTEGILKIMQEAVAVGQEKEKVHDYENDIDERMKQEVTGTIPFPFENWNERTQGGMHIGDLIMILAPKGGGKSWLAATISAHVKNLAKNVLYYTLELDSTMVANRIDAHYLREPVKYVHQHEHNLKYLLSEKSGKIKIVRLKGKKKTLSYIKQHTTMLRNEGFIPDLVVIDYIDILRTTNTDAQAGTKELYEDVRDWASEEQFVCLSPAQINRSGIKSAVIEGDMVAGFLEKLQVADQVYIMGRPREHKKAKTCVIVTDKNRYGDDGMAELFHANLAWGDFEYLSEYTEDEGEGEGQKKKSTIKESKNVNYSYIENVKARLKDQGATA